MLSFFKRTPEQLAVAELKRIRNAVLKAGGPERVCYAYWKFLEGNALFKELGVATVDGAPFPKMMAVMSALDLLNSWKKTSDKDPNIKELMELLARRVYVAALLSLDHEGLAALHAQAGGVPGEITTDSEAAIQIETRLRAEVEARKSTAEAAWLRWKNAEFDVFEAIRSA